MSLDDKAAAKSNAGPIPSDSLSVPADLIELGRVIGAHGIKGWIKVQPFSSDSQALGASKTWWLRTPVSPLQASDHKSNSAKATHLVWAKPHGATWIACVKGLNDRDQAESLKGQTVLVSRSAFPKLGADEYYWVDLIGCTVTTSAQGESAHLGVVDSVQDNPAHPILMVKQQMFNSDGQLVDCVDDKGKLVYSLIPFVSAHVGDIDINARTIATHWPRDF